MAIEKSQLLECLAEWQTLLGQNPMVEDGNNVRELWSVVSTYGQQFFLKRLGPWRNLPVLSEYRMLIHLLEEGVQVPAFLLTDDGSLTAGPTEDSFVLMRAFNHEHRLAADIPRFESEVGLLHICTKRCLVIHSLLVPTRRI
jgi:hypothetical protein